MFCISKLVSEKGEKVALSGLGADELFAGYKSFQLLPKMLDKTYKLAKLKFILRPLIEKIEPYLSPKFRRVGDAVRKPESLVAAHHAVSFPT